MSDLIDRQAAIDEIDEWIKAFRESGHKQSAADARLIQDGIIKLSSAQPEIIRCKDCKWWDKYNDNMGYCMAARHTAYSTNWEIQIRRTYKGDFYCAHAELEEENMDEVETE